MKNQVTSIEQSLRLMELGVPAEKASMGWFGPDYDVLCNKESADNYTMTELGEYWQDSDYIPAFTVADLLGMIPKKITTQRGSVYMLHIAPCSSTSPCWYLYWGNEDVQIGWQEQISFLHLLEDAIEWLLSNGYELEG